MTPPDHAPVFAARLAAAMREAGLSVAALAAASGLSVPGLYHLLAGERRAPSWSTVQALARALAVSTEALRTDG